MQLSNVQTMYYELSPVNCLYIRQLQDVLQSPVGPTTLFCVFHLEQLHTQSPFLFPIVFGMNMFVCMFVSKNDILHWVNTPTQDSCFGVVGHHQRGVECEPLESQAFNIIASAEPLGGCKLSRVSTLACAI